MKTISFLHSNNNSNSISRVGDNLISGLREMGCNVLLFNDDKDLVGGKNIVSNFDLQKLKFLKAKNIIPYFSYPYSLVPKIDYYYLKDFDNILVYNNHTKSVLCESGFKEDNIFVLPIGIDCKKFRRSTPLIDMGGRFPFLNIVDISKGNRWVNVVESYYQSFCFDDNVILVLKAYNQKYQEYYQNQIVREIEVLKKKFQKKLPPIYFVESEMSDDEIIGLYKSCSAYVKLYNTNSGLSFLEALASDLVCIGPDVGGCRDIIDKSNSFIIETKRKERSDNMGQLSSFVSNVFDHEQLSCVLKYVYDNYAQVKEKFLEKRKVIIPKFDRRLSSFNLYKYLKTI